MEKRRVIGSVIVALLVLISQPLQAMCSQCRFMIAGRNCSGTHARAATTEQAEAAKIPGEHCEHVANSQSRSRSHFISRASCQGQPCQQLTDLATTMNRVDSAQLVASFRSVAPAEASDNDPVAEEPLRGHAETYLLNPSALQPLSVSLRI